VALKGVKLFVGEPREPIGIELRQAEQCITRDISA
jgi:hypothetical protein